MNRSPWVSHFGFSRTPFTKSIAAKDLYRRAAHDEAVARIGFVVAETGLGVIGGEVGVGETVAVRGAEGALGRLRPPAIYVPHPATGTPGPDVTIVSAL